ncbi:MAG: TonB family protein [Burkholderiales bacterium]|nr:TonB family protein [Burkholderiales bacterium]
MTAITATLERMPVVTGPPATVSSAVGPESAGEASKPYDDEAAAALSPVARDTPVPAVPGVSGTPSPPAVEPPGSTLSRMADPTYYPASELDRYPALLQPLALDYPERAAAAGASGKVVVMLLIDETGMVNEVSVVESDPLGYFEAAVRAALAGARFSPARRNDRAVRSRLLVSVDYAPEGER